MTDAAVADTAAVPADALAGSPAQRARLDQLRLFLTHWRGSLATITLGTVAVAMAWGDLVPWPLRAAWCLLGCCNYLAQGVVCWQLERAPQLAAALPRRLPWLQATVAGSGIVWGLVPWMVASASNAVLLFAACFNLILVFAVVNAPGSRAMVLCAVLPVMLLTVPPMLWHGGLFYPGLACAVLFGLTLFYGLRVQAALQATMVARHAAHDLADALQRQQQRLIALEGERTRLLERQRLVRDLHDGLGSTLSASLIAAEKGQAGAVDLVPLLRECVDELRAVIDSQDPIDCDVVALLAALRYRTGARLERAGIRLEWDVQDLPALPWMGPSDALQLLRLLQEMFANIARHAGAQRVRVSTRPADQHVVINVADDGCGFDPQAAPPGRGLRFMSHRAALLGGRLRIESSPGHGTQLWLELPLARGGAVSAP